MSHSLQSSASFLSISGYGQDKQPQQSGPASGPQLRPLPAYANVNVVQQPAAPQTPSSSANPFFSQTPASTKPAPKYQSRERLYYLPNLPTERPASTTIQPSTYKFILLLLLHSMFCFRIYACRITKPTSAGIGDSTKEEPPTTSLYDDPLSPEHRHILERPQAAFVCSIAFLFSSSLILRCRSPPDHCMNYWDRPPFLQSPQQCL